MLNFLQKKYFGHKETIDNFSWRALQTFGKQGITFLIFFLCASLLTPYDFGVYNYILAFLGLLIMFGDFGISTATSKFVAEYNVVDKRKLRLVLFNSLALIVVLGLVVSLFTIVFGEYFLGDKYGFVLYALPLLFLVPISSLYDGIYRGLKKFKELAVISVSVGLLSVSFVYFLVSQYGLIGALVSQSLFSFFLVSILAIKYGKIYFEFDKVFLKKILNYSLIVGLGSLGYYMYRRFDILILGHFGYITEINHFEIITKISVLFSSIFGILGTVLAPNITALKVKGDSVELLKKFKKVFLLGFLLSIFVSVIIYFSFPVIMSLFFEDLLTDGFMQVFSILIWFLPFTTISKLISQGFTVATGNAKIGLLTIPFGVLNVILAIVFINLFGFIGVAYSSVLVSTISKFVSWGVLYRILYKDAINL